MAITRKQVFTFCCIMTAIEEEFETEKRQYERTHEPIHVERMQTLKHNYRQYGAIVQAETSPDKLHV